MKKIFAVMSLALAMLLAACAPTETSRSTGQTMDDIALTARVKTEIAKAQGMGEAVAINVDTFRGVVSLAGFVESEEQRRNAEMAARRVNGVQKVFNNLQLKSRK